MSLDNYEAATAEAGDPSEEMHPHAPEGSRAFGDPYVHYITNMQTSQDVIRFWYPEKQDSDQMPVDYELLQKQISWAGDESRELDQDLVILLVTEVFFYFFTNDYYKDEIKSFSFRRIGEDEIKVVPYVYEWEQIPV